MFRFVMVDCFCDVGGNFIGFNYDLVFDFSMDVSFTPLTEGICSDEFIILILELSRSKFFFARSAVAFSVWFIYCCSG